MLWFCVLLLTASSARRSRHRLADGLQSAGPVLLALAGLVLVAGRQAGIGGMMLSGAAAWYGAMRMARPASKTPGKRSTVRTAALEMELDHDTGGLEGLVLAGRHEGKMLGSMAGGIAGALRANSRAIPRAASY